MPTFNPESGSDHVPFEEVVAFEKLVEIITLEDAVPEKTSEEVLD